MFEPLYYLKTVFGYPAFRGQQASIIQSVLSGQSTLVCMPTGAGKSLCYQIPALCLPGLTLVISPLIALMQDQTDRLQALGVQANFLSSTQHKMDQQNILRSLPKILYISPERIQSDDFLNWLQKQSLSLFAFDEAHCISEWGHDFRPSYRDVCKLIERFPRITKMALTATATTRTQADIMEVLRFNNPHQFIGSYNRPNIAYSLTPKVKASQQLIHFIQRRHHGHSGLIYCRSRQNVMALTQWLNQNHLKTLPYHAGLPRQIRSEHQKLFLRNPTLTMVATIAFGMGIDKSNIRFVVHWDCPKSPEGYYQETGRAGRDGSPAEALLFIGQHDIEKQHPLSEYIQEEKCRRHWLLKYFGETSPTYCGNCDVCQPDMKYWGQIRKNFHKSAPWNTTTTQKKGRI